MAFYHVAFTVCMTMQGAPQHCEPEKLVDTMLHGLVRCYTAAKEVENMTVKSANEMASKQNVTLTDVQVKTRCLTTSEGEEFLKKAGPSALIITGKKFE
jgi:hypothetical protein